jgi:hypothetical protein
MCNFSASNATLPSGSPRLPASVFLGFLASLGFISGWDRMFGFSASSGSSALPFSSKPSASGVSGIRIESGSIAVFNATDAER